MAIKSDMLQKLDSELSEAKEKQKFHAKRATDLATQIERLTQARKALAEILTSEDDKDEEGSAPAKRTRAPSANKVDLPRTDKAWWLSLITSAPQGTQAIAKAALVKAGIKEDEAEKVAAMKQRQAVNLKNLCDDGSITSEGEQQKRVFFLPKQAKQA